MKSIDSVGYNWIYLAPFHDIIKENLEYSKLRNYTFLHLKGKDQEGVCLAPEYKEYASRGLNITPFCETRCTLRHGKCPYYETKDKIEKYPSPWAGVHAHVPTYLQSFLFTKKYKKKLMFHHYDVLILDEFPFSTIYNQVIVNKQDIDDLRNVLSYMNGSYEKDVLLDILNEFMLSTDAEGIKYSRVKDLINNNRGLNYESFSEEYDNMLLQLVMEETIKKPPKNIIFGLSKIYDSNPKIERLKWNIYKHNGDKWLRSGIYITTSNLEYFKSLPITIIALDATADVRAWNKLLNNRCEYVSIDIEYKNIFQLKTRARYPVSTWLQFKDGKMGLSKSGIKLCELIKKICSDNKRDVLLCCNKRIKREINKYLKENYNRKNYQFAIFYNLRSRNEFYKDCDTCIITHEPNIPKLQSEILTNIFDWEGSMLKNLMTFSEIKQGIGRIRQNIYETPEGEERNTIEIYVLPGAYDERDINAKILPEAKIISYNDMYAKNLVNIQEKLKEVLKLGKVFSLDDLYSILDESVTYNNLKYETKKLWKDGYISNYKRNIQWVYNEVKAREVKYKIKD